ncbi:MliC family protein [Paracoccus sp. 11-3]|uniref:MliC family protein n=1 Tax=Paracoccus amoyensis TaxID=2760093 RepID=A0A926GHU2_9RHOB|nr:MliC family protein [Paracoccus amoyensis]MBC9247257.1 MliC family protein [Paracoccus amoyensis]
MQKFLSFIAASCAAISPSVGAAAVIVQFATGEETSVTSTSYVCAGGEPFRVQYVNGAANSLALIPIDGTERVFVNVVSASGARYVSGEYEWWSKGDGAMLDNLMDDAEPQECTSGDTATQ